MPPNTPAPVEDRDTPEAPGAPALPADPRADLGILRDPRVGRDLQTSATAIAAICNSLTLTEGFDRKLLGLVGLIRDAAEEAVRVQGAAAGAAPEGRTFSRRAREVGAARIILLGRADGTEGDRLSVGTDAFCATVVQVIEGFVEATLHGRPFSALSEEERTLGATMLSDIIFGYTGHACDVPTLIEAMESVGQKWLWDHEEPSARAQVFVRLLGPLGLAYNAGSLHQALKRQGIVG